MTKLIEIVKFKTELVKIENIYNFNIETYRKI